METEMKGVPRRLARGMKAKTKTPSSNVKRPAACRTYTKGGNTENIEGKHQNQGKATQLV